MFNLYLRKSNRKSRRSNRRRQQRGGVENGDAGQGPMEKEQESEVRNVDNAGNEELGNAGVAQEEENGASEKKNGASEEENKANKANNGEPALGDCACSCGDNTKTQEGGRRQRNQNRKTNRKSNKQNKKRQSNRRQNRKSNKQNNRKQNRKSNRLSNRRQ